MGAVSRETLAALERELDLPGGAGDQIGRLLTALSSEPDPHTTVADPARALDVHVRDSLSALRFGQIRSATRIADLGAGAGFPGLPLAIALPEAQVDLVEAARRKCALIDRLIAASSIRNARSLPVRAEDLAGGAGRGAYDAVTARAVAPLAVLVEYAAPLLGLGGVLVAWKGAVDPAESAGGDHAASLVGLERSEIAPVTPYPSARGLYLYLYSKVRDTPSKYPRRTGVAAKRPLVA